MTASERSERDRRALKALGIALVIAALWLGQGTIRGLGVSAATLESLEQRYLLAKQTVARRPTEADYSAKLRQSISVVEARLLRSETPALAQAELRSLVTGLLGAVGVDSLRSEFGVAVPDYGQYEAVALDLEFSCSIDQLVDFMAALANAHRILATRTVEIRSQESVAGPVHIRLTVEGYLRTPASSSAPEAVSR